MVVPVPGSIGVWSGDGRGTMQYDRFPSPGDSDPENLICAWFSRNCTMQGVWGQSKVRGHTTAALRYLRAAHHVSPPANTLGV